MRHANGCTRGSNGKHATSWLCTQTPYFKAQNGGSTKNPAQAAYLSHRPKIENGGSSALPTFCYVRDCDGPVRRTTDRDSKWRATSEEAADPSRAFLRITLSFQAFWISVVVPDVRKRLSSDFQKDLTDGFHH